LDFQPPATLKVEVVSAKSGQRPRNEGMVFIPNIKVRVMPMNLQEVMVARGNLPDYFTAINHRGKTDLRVQNAVTTRIIVIYIPVLVLKGTLVMQKPSLNKMQTEPSAATVVTIVLGEKSIAGSEKDEL
jgi:hypothetical protein